MTRFVVVALFLAACLPSPSPVVPAPVDPNATPETACAALSRLHCPESKPAANGASCPDVVRKAMQLRNLDLACITVAIDIASVRECGSIRCRE